MEHVVFLLPLYCDFPIGGYKIIYEYSNRLVNDGYKVTLIFPDSLLLEKLGWYKKMRGYIRYWRHKRRNHEITWFHLDPNIQIKFVFSLDEVHAWVDADYYIATAVETSFYLNDYKKVPASYKYYFIQSFEDWNLDSQLVDTTWKFKLKKIVIAPWLLQYAVSLGEKAALVENGFDFSSFKKMIDYKDRNKYQVAMLYHQMYRKGCGDGLAALNLVHEKIPELKVTLFGTYNKPPDIPNWIDYYQNPNKILHNRIYNEAAIFVGPSHAEGWGLTVGEAMQCGCAVACTDNGGHLAMAYHNETALVSKVKDVNGLADNIITLIEDDELRYRIARNGYLNIHQYTMDRAYSKFEQALHH